MARALIPLLLLLLAGCAPSTPPAEPGGGPRSYTLVAWFEGASEPGLIVTYRLDRGAQSSNGQADWDGRTAAWSLSPDGLYVLNPAGKIGGFELAAVGDLLTRWPLLTSRDPLALLDPGQLAERLSGCTRVDPGADWTWTHPDPLGEGNATLSEALSGGAISGICSGTPLRGELWRDADTRVRLLGLELPGVRVEWSDLGPGPDPLLLAPAALPQTDLPAFLGLR